MLNPSSLREGTLTFQDGRQERTTPISFQASRKMTLLRHLFLNLRPEAQSSSLVTSVLQTGISVDKATVTVGNHLYPRGPLRLSSPKTNKGEHFNLSLQHSKVDNMCVAAAGFGAGAEGGSKTTLHLYPTASYTGTLQVQEPFHS